MASQEVEVEKKYDVGADAEVPDLTEVPGVARVGEPRVDHLEAVYFDTEDSALAARGITLRRRTGGSDAGWHAKLPPRDGAGSESPGGSVFSNPSGAASFGRRWASPASFLTSCWRTCWCICAATIRCLLFGWRRSAPPTRFTAMTGSTSRTWRMIGSARKSSRAAARWTRRPERSSGGNGNSNWCTEARTCFRRPRIPSRLRGRARRGTGPSWLKHCREPGGARSARGAGVAASAVNPPP